MNTILGIKFREYGQIYYFLAGQCAPVIGNRVIVETEQGQGIGEVVLIRDSLPASALPQAGASGVDMASLPATDAAIDATDDATPAFLITNAITSAVVMPQSDLTVADIPYASTVAAKVQAMRQRENLSVSEEAQTEQAVDIHAEFAHAMTEYGDVDDAYEDDDVDADFSENFGAHAHQCCGHGHSETETTEENLDGVLVASADIDDLIAETMDNEVANTNHVGEAININNTANHGGRMVSYDGSAGEHSSDTQPPEDTSQPLSFDDLRPILRIATEYDLEHATSNDFLSREASAYCKECIKQRELDMKLVDVEVFFDLSKFIFYFTAPSRIDFRELVKDLVKHYRTRIELRQIGVRHETQMIGAVGNCGMVCCCRRFLRKFAPVTIKMAKEQNLFLNPAKISGICGRLLCCLSYEQENYEEFHRRCPRLGKKYMTSKGPIKVMRANMFRNSLIAYSESGEELEIPLEEWQEMEVRRPDASGQAPRANRRDKTAGAPEKAEKQDASPAQKPVLGCTGTCERCGECGPSASRSKKSEGGSAKAMAQPDDVATVAASPESNGGVTPKHSPDQGDMSTTAPSQVASIDAAVDSATAESAKEHSAVAAPKPIQATVHDAEQVMASLSGVHQPPSGVSEHGIPTTQARQAALVQSLAGMDGGPLCSLAKPEKPVTPAVIAAHVIGDVASAAEVAAKQAPASIAMPERSIKSTDTSALKTSRGRRKRRRKPRDGGNAQAFDQGNNTFDDTDMDE